LEQQHAKFKTLIAEINLAKTTDPRIQSAKLGAGNHSARPRRGRTADQAGVKREPMADNGLWFVRRTSATGLNYFLANRGDKPVDQWITLGVPPNPPFFLTLALPIAAEWRRCARQRRARRRFTSNCCPANPASCEPSPRPQ